MSDNGNERDREFGAFADAVKSAAERDEAFWARQRAGIRDRIDRRAAVTGWGLALAGATALAVAVLQLPGGNLPPITDLGGAPTTAIIESAEPDDDELLADVETAMAREMPAAFEPAAWLLAEARGTNTALDEDSP